MKKLASLLLALVIIMSCFSAMAQTIGTASDNTGVIIISNAAKGVTYTIYKLFDASVTGTDGGSIAYTGTIPQSLSAYFTKDDAGNISATEAATNEKGEMSDALRAALKTWAETATITATAESDGSELSFVGLDYGYYVVTTTQGEQAITVDSTNPTANIFDKNSTTIKELTKTANDTDVNIGDTVTYTVTFKTANYSGTGADAKKIVEYTISDTLPDFLSNVSVTSIIIDNDANSTTTADQTDVTAQFVDKKITIKWYDETTKKFLYDNGALVTITYTAVVADQAAIDGAGNTNKVTLTWKDIGGTTPPEDDQLTDEETIYTYAIALKKVNEKGIALSGAVFQLPFYVKSTPDTDGAYVYAGTTAGEGLTNQLTTPESGEITIKGVASGAYSITEITAPAGYNKLTEAVTVTAVKTSATTTTTTFYLDENGNLISAKTETSTEVTYQNDKLSATPILVVNKTGAELPSTGGMGTTILYVGGGILVLAAIVLLIAKRRSTAE